VSRTLEDFEVLGLAERPKANGKNHTLTPYAQKLLQGAGCDFPPKCI
jgi:hypothetical protein